MYVYVAGNVTKVFCVSYLYILGYPQCVVHNRKKKFFFSNLSTNIRIFVDKTLDHFFYEFMMILFHVEVIVRVKL